MKKAIISLFLSFFYFSLLAQPFFNKYLSYDFDNYYEISYSKSGDLIYVLNKNSWFGTTLTAFDTKGSVIWYKSIKVNNDNFSDDCKTNLLSTKNEGVIFGVKSVDNNQNQTLRIVKFDKNGNLIWNKKLLQTPKSGWESIVQIYANQQEEIYAIAFTKYKEDYLIAKLDKDGNEILTKKVKIAGGEVEGAILDPLHDKLIFYDDYVSVFNNKLELVANYLLPMYARNAMYFNDRLYFIGQQSGPPYRAEIICTDATDLKKIYWMKSANKFDFNQGHFANDGKDIYVSYDHLNFNFNNPFPPNGIIYKMSENGDKIWSKQFDKCGGSKGVKMNIHGAKMLLAHSSIQQIDTSGNTDCYALDITDSYFKPINKTIIQRPAVSNFETHTYPTNSNDITINDFQYLVRDVCYEKDPPLDLGIKENYCIGDTLSLLPAFNSYYRFFWGEFTNSKELIFPPNFQYGFNSAQKDTMLVTLVYGKSCEREIKYPFEVTPKPTYEPVKDTTDCGDGIKVSLDKNFKYTWKDGDSLASKTLKGNQDYALTITDQFGCSIERSIKVNPLQVPNIQKDTLICEHLPFTFDLSKFENAIIENQNIGKSFTSKEDKIFKLKAKYKGCEIEQSLFVKREPCPAQIYIPTAFSPNDDGINDYFEIFSNEIEIINYSIYNRWGDKVFTFENPNENWNGKFKNTTVLDGIYTYHLRFLNKRNQQVEDLAGDILLLRGE